MLFFKRILDVSKAPEVTTNRRAASRFVVNPEFPVTAVLNIADRDMFGNLPKNQNKRVDGTDWSVQLLNLSSTGARLQVPDSVKAKRDDFGRLKLDVQGYQLIVPGRIAHIAEEDGYRIIGLVLDLSTANTQAGYRQLIELVALGSSLTLVKPSQADGSGYLIEQYAGEPSSRLSIWREPAGQTVTAFEFLLKDCLVRGLEGKAGLDFFTGAEARKAQPASPAQGAEIKRLYQWVVLNLPPAVPADARAFLQQRAT